MDEADRDTLLRMGLGVGDTKRTEKAFKGIEGKHLTYRRAGGGQTA